MHQSSFFFFNDTATTEIYTLSLHDALPISNATFSLRVQRPQLTRAPEPPNEIVSWLESGWEDRKSTRLNSSHSQISYAVFCLTKKNLGQNFAKAFDITYTDQHNQVQHASTT